MSAVAGRDGCTQVVVLGGPGRVYYDQVRHDPATAPGPGSMIPDSNLRCPGLESQMSRTRISDISDVPDSNLRNPMTWLEDPNPY